MMIPKMIKFSIKARIVKKLTWLITIGPTKVLRKAGPAAVQIENSSFIAGIPSKGFP